MIAYLHAVVADPYLAEFAVLEVQHLRRISRVLALPLSLAYDDFFRSAKLNELFAGCLWDEPSQRRAGLHKQGKSGFLQQERLNCGNLTKVCSRKVANDLGSLDCGEIFRC